MQLHVKRLRPDAKLPVKAEEDACWDFFCVDDEEFSVIDGRLGYILEPIVNFNGLRMMLDFFHPNTFGAETMCTLFNQFRIQKSAHIFHTGVACAFPQGYGAFLWDRSGLGAKHRIHRLAGVIDSGYRNEWLVCLINLGDKPYVVYDGDKIIQCAFQKMPDVEVIEVDSLSESIRGESGFGSTGR